MYNLLLIFDGVIQNNVKPILADVQFGDWIIFNNLEDEIVSSLEDSFECIILCLLFLINLLQYFEAHFLNNFEQLLTYF